MNPHSQFSHNESAATPTAAAAMDHIVIHSHKERPYRCKRCGRTFTEEHIALFLQRGERQRWGQSSRIIAGQWKSC